MPWERKRSGEHRALCLPRGSTEQSNREMVWGGGPVTGMPSPLPHHSVRGCSSPPRQERHDITELFVAFPDHADGWGTGSGGCGESPPNFQTPDTPGWDLSSGSAPLLSSWPPCFWPSQDLDDQSN